MEHCAQSHGRSEGTSNEHIDPHEQKDQIIMAGTWSPLVELDVCHSYRPGRSNISRATWVSHEWVVVPSAIPWPDLRDLALWNVGEPL